MTPCLLCQDDGWYAEPSFVDEAKGVIRVVLVPCPNGCPMKPEPPEELPN